MAEEKDKSLDQQIKEAELAKLNAETADLEKRSKQARVMGVPIVQIIFGGIVVGFVLLNYIQPLVNLNTDISTKEKDYNEIKDRLERIEIEARSKDLELLADSLQTEQTKLAGLNDLLTQETAALEQQTKEAKTNLASVQKRIAALNAQERNLQIKIRITEAFGALDSARYANALQQYEMIKAKNYYDKNLNPDGKGIDNQFQLPPGDSVIFDAATGLTWQQSGSGIISYSVADDEYIQKTNAETYGGYNDWRLPTLEEGMSLMEPGKKNDLYISGQFDKGQILIWTSDKPTASRAWYVIFINGNCFKVEFEDSIINV